jgi:hypothetical protein
MAKIALPAFSEANRFFKKNWRGVMVLALKTYLTILLLHLLVGIPAQVIIGPQMTLKLHLNPISVWDLPPLLIIMNIVAGVVGYFLSQWLISPLYISICRSVILGEPFDRFLFRHLTATRTLRVAKLLWSLLIIIIPVYVAGFALLLLAQPSAQGIGGVSFGVFLPLLLAAPIYLVVFIYITMRVYYLIPPLACDRHFSNLSDLWSLSRGKAWSIFKVFLLLGFISICVGLVFFAIFMVLFVGFIAVFQGVGKLIVGTVIGALIVLLAVTGLIVFVLIIPQLVTATIANVYKLSQLQTNEP